MTTDKILRLTMECCRLLQKIYKALFRTKTLRKGIQYGGNSGALSTKKVRFFIGKCPFWPISNAALNFQNIPWS